MIIKPENIVTVPLKIARKWCTMAYPRHKKGCPNYHKCKNSRRHRIELRDEFDLTAPIYIVWVGFSLDAHEARMQNKHPDWTEAQCRNLMYWQPSVDRQLKDRVNKVAYENELYGYSPVYEGYGLNVFLTCYKSGIKLDRFDNLHNVRKLCFLMKRKKRVSKQSRGIGHLGIVDEEF